MDLIRMCRVDENKHITSHLRVTQFAEKTRIVNLCKKRNTLVGKKQLIFLNINKRKGFYVISPSYILGIHEIQGLHCIGFGNVREI